jgi:hypothetical protein
LSKNVNVLMTKNVQLDMAIQCKIFCSTYTGIYSTVANKKNLQDKTLKKNYRGKLKNHFLAA